MVLCLTKLLINGKFLPDLVHVKNFSCLASGIAALLLPRVNILIVPGTCVVNDSFGVW